MQALNYEYPSEEKILLINNIIDQYAEDGLKINAIKKLRDALALGLKETKDFIEATENGERDLIKLFRAAGLIISTPNIPNKSRRNLRPEMPDKLPRIEIYKKANVDLELFYPDNEVNIQVVRGDEILAKVTVHEKNGDLVLEYHTKSIQSTEIQLVEDILKD